MQADVAKAHSQIAELQSALAASRADAEEARAGSAQALSPVEDALQQVPVTAAVVFYGQEHPASVLQ